MTTYTLIETQRKQLIEGYESGNVVKYVPALVLLRNLRPNTQEPVGKIEHLDELNERWTKHLPIGTKLYTRPAPQQVPLTEDALINVIATAKGQGVIGIARAIEQAHGIV